jgi:hypothetical protein
MYEETKFDETGWLWIKSTPDGEWVKASAERTISELWDKLKFYRLRYLEDLKDRAERKLKAKEIASLIHYTVLFNEIRDRSMNHDPNK